ncbi:conjugal transfer protein [Enterococcus faecalis]|uniref:conjugal transfer protein n=1 Tax=Enterococcus faecalis TaxID=1351 RepID=UPI0035CB25CD
MLAGVAIATPALNPPPYLTGGYKSTRNRQKNSKKPIGYKGFDKFRCMSDEFQ